MATFKMSTGAPAKKVTFSAVAAAIATVVVGLVPDDFLGGNVEDLRTAIVTIVTFLAGYFVQPAPNDTIERVGSD